MPLGRIIGYFLIFFIVNVFTLTDSVAAELYEGKWSIGAPDSETVKEERWRYRWSGNDPSKFTYHYSQAEVVEVACASAEAHHGDRFIECPTNVRVDERNGIFVELSYNTRSWGRPAKRELWYLYSPIMQRHCPDPDYPHEFDEDGDGNPDRCFLRDYDCDEWYHPNKGINPAEVRTNINWENGGNALSVKRYHYPYGLTVPEHCVNVHPQNPKKCDGGDGVGNPIGCATGQKRQKDIFYSTQGAHPIVVGREFTSEPAFDIKAASSWGHRHSLRYRFIVNDEFARVVEVLFNSGHYYNEKTQQYVAGAPYNIIFTGGPDDTVLRSSHPRHGTFVIGEGERAYITQKGNRYDFYANGTLKARTTSDNAWTMNHAWTKEGDNVVETITNHFGQSVRITHSEFPEYGGIPLSFETPDGALYRYVYDGTRKLTAVIFPDNTPNDDSDNPRRQYVYENSDFPNNLTGIIDANGDRFATWTYNRWGQAISSEHGEGIEKITLEYDTLEQLNQGLFDLEQAPNFDGTLATFQGDRFEGSTIVNTHIDDDRVRKERYHFKRQGGRDLITKIEDLDTGLFTESTYDAKGLLLASKDRNGTVTEYLRDGDGRVTRVVEAMGTPEENTTHISWDNAHNKVFKITRDDIKLGHVYNADGQLASFVQKDQKTQQIRTINYEYNAQNLVSRIDGPRTDVDDSVSFGYDNGNLVSVTNALGHVSTLSDYTADGRVQKLTDANGIETLLRYHPRGWLTEIERAGATTRYDYDAVGQVTQITQANGVTLNFEYDHGHRLTAVIDGQGNRQELTYNALGNVVKSTLQDPNGLLTYQQRQVFDELGRLSEQLGNNGQSQSLAYDANGNPVETIDGEGQRSTNSFDKLNRLKETLDPLQGKTSIEYDIANRPIQVIDAAERMTQYRYNGFGDLLTQVSPDTGITKFEVDEAGNVIAQTDARNITVRYTYDALGRLTFIDYPNNDLDTTFTYDEGAYAIGRLSVVSNAHSTQRFTYDDQGNTVSVEQIIDGQTYTTAYEYDNAGLMTAVTYPSGKTLRYGLNSLGQIESAIWDGQTVADDIEYLPFGPVSHLEFGNGIALDNTYDKDYRLINRSDQHTQQIQYGYTLRDNINSIVDDLNTRSSVFEYDALARLTQTVGGEAFQYDAIGNRVAAAEVEQPEENAPAIIIDANSRVCEPEAPETPEAQLIGSWQLDGNLNATNNAALSGSPVGNVVFLSEAEAGRSAIRLDGQSAVVMPASDALNLNSFTLSAWIRTDNAGSGYRGIALKHFAFGLFLYNNQLATYDWTGYQRTDTGIALNDGQWHHVMLSRDDASQRYSIYVDGTLVREGVSGIANHNHAFVLGAGDGAGTSQRFQGDIADVKIFDQAITPAELNGETGSASDEEMNDKTCISPNAWLGDWNLAGQTVETGGALISGGYEFDFDEQSQRAYLKLDGQSGSYVGLGNDANVQQEAFTLSAWIRTNGAGSGYRGIAVKNGAYGIFLYNNTLASYDWSISTRINTSKSLGDGQWHFVTMTREAGARAPMKLYADGELVLEMETGIGNQNSSLSVGAGGPAGDYQNFSGDIASVSLLNYAASNSEIMQLMTGSYQPSEPDEQKDAHGNILNDGNNSYEYNDAGRLSKSINKDGLATQYFYNANQQRIKKVNANETIHYVYDLSGLLIGEYDQSGNALIEYLYLNGQRVGIVKNGELYYTHTNHLDAPTAVTDNNGVIVWQAHYDAFGNITVTQDTIGGLSARLPGQYEDRETGLYYNWHRYYDPRKGRYITSDPLGLYDGTNTYAYVQNSPLNNVDSKGLYWHLNTQTTYCMRNPIHCGELGGDIIKNPGRLARKHGICLNEDYENFVNFYDKVLNVVKVVDNIKKAVGKVSKAKDAIKKVAKERGKLSPRDLKDAYDSIKDGWGGLVDIFSGKVLETRRVNYFAPFRDLFSDGIEQERQSRTPRRSWL